MSPLQRAKMQDAIAALIKLKQSTRALAETMADSNPEMGYVYEHAKEIAFEALNIVEWAKQK